jgi:hypothetical protein
MVVKGGWWWWLTKDNGVGVPMAGVKVNNIRYSSGGRTHPEIWGKWMKMLMLC